MGAALFANTRQFTLNKVTGNIDQFKRLLGSGLIDHSQKMTAAAMQIAEK
jgi:hypothetical protein